MAYIPPIGPSPEQPESRLGGGHGCDIHDRAFSYRTTRERPLTWIGRGLDETGIRAGTELTDDQFDNARALIRGQHPITGEQLVQPKVEVPRDAKLPLSP